MITTTVLVVTAVTIFARFIGLIRRRRWIDVPIFLAGSTLSLIGAFAVGLWFEDVRFINWTGNKLGIRKSITGTFSVKDGDSLVYEGVELRLVGIDAAELSQCCVRSDGRQELCGELSKKRLQDRIGRKPVSCSWAKTDRNGRPLATCFIGNLDLNSWSVRRGNAFAYHVKRRNRYVPVGPYRHDQTKAHGRRLGVHGYETIMLPNHFRKIGKRMQREFAALCGQ